MDENNPYAPPTAELEASAEGQSRPLPFYAVSPLKLVVLSVATFGYYLVYWHYRQWKAIRDAEGRKLWPIPRAFFAALTGFELYPHIHATARRESVEVSWQGWMPAVAAFGINLVVWASNFASSSIPGLGLVWLLAILPPWVAQATIQALHTKVRPGADPNARFTVWNVLWLLLGLLLWVAVLLSHVPKDRPA